MSVTDFNIHYLTSTLADGNFSFNYGSQAEVVTNRQNFLATHQLQLQDCAVMQVLDDTEIHVVNKTDKGRGALSYDNVIMADALVTTEKNLLLFLLTADCLPLTLYYPVQQVIGLAHLGRKSSEKLLATALITFLQQHFGTQPADLKAFLGPAIRQQSYILRREYVQLGNDWSPFIEEVSDLEIAIDIVGFNTQLLIQQGVQPSHIMTSPIDTYTSNHFFSHYRSVKKGEAEGRFATLVGLH